MKEVEVYFKNENDAESARADLAKYNVKNLVIENVPEGKTGGFVPFLSPNQGAGGPAIPFLHDDSKEDNNAKEADPEHMSHLLRFEVNDSDYNEVNSVLNNYDTYKVRSDREE